MSKPKAAVVHRQQFYKARNLLRMVTATSLFDGHDASINIMRRILQAAGVELIHLGHNRSVAEIVTAALEEDVHAIAVSSYQGGHVEYFRYMIDMLAERGGSHIKVFGGGGGVIVPSEIKALEDYGVTRIYAPADGQALGLEGMIDDIRRRADADLGAYCPSDLKALTGGDRVALAHLISALEAAKLDKSLLIELRGAAAQKKGPPVLGITGTGGAGKSSLTDEVIRRFRLDFDDALKIAVIAIDPSRRKSGGALLGDRIRMNAIGHENIFMRSLATRKAGAEVPAHLDDILSAVRLSGFDLIIIETPGIGQGDAGILPFVDLSLYVMTPEFGAASQLEKIDMLDFADFVAINKFERRGARDALRDVQKQLQRNRKAFDAAPDDMPVFGTVASRFNDDGVTALYQGMLEGLREKGLAAPTEGRLAPVGSHESSDIAVLIPGSRQRYLAEVAEGVRDYHSAVDKQVRLARERQALAITAKLFKEEGKENREIEKLLEQKSEGMDRRAARLLEQWPAVREAYSGDEYVVKIRGAEIRTGLSRKSLSGSDIPKVALPRFEDDGETLRWLLKENLPGSFPYTAGVFPFKRESEDPSRMFAGEGDCFQTNRRFHLLSRHAPAKRLSTAFDSVTLYRFDPDERPDIYGKVGNSGVSIATLDDMKALYAGFDLCDPSTSVSMTINGPAPTILAMFLNAAIDQQVDKFEAENKRPPTDEEAGRISSWVLENVRGTVQADILKEDQGQNTCIFSTEFALGMMGDIAEYFVDHKVRNFYSVSISGYHIAEAGANPITQLAFTLANGFTYVESYLARGLKIDDFAPNLSFFFSNGMDPEYAVLGRVARRIWSTAMRFRYGANARSQKLKYHVQTSGRSLHAQEMEFNDIRTTLQALIATYDNCNSLHTNAFDEAVTTPTGESVRRALAIQMIINKEWGLAMNENPNQGAFIIDHLTDLVEEAVLAEFERLSERGGVLGAMETGYMRGRIQDESILYESRKHDGSLPIIGVNTFLAEHRDEAAAAPVELARSTEKVKQGQLKRLRAFQKKHRKECSPALDALKRVAMDGGNSFEALMKAVRYCSLGQISDALFEVGGRYRRNM